jgi:hypothetical protein
MREVRTAAATLDGVLAVGLADTVLHSAIHAIADPQPGPLSASESTSLPRSCPTVDHLVLSDPRVGGLRHLDPALP